MTDRELEGTLKQLPLRELAVRVQGRPGHVVAEVSSPDFSGQDKGMRQRR